MALAVIRLADRREELVSIRFDDLKRFVGAAIVDDNVLDRGIILRKNRLDRLAQISRLIVRRRHNCNFRKINSQVYYSIPTYECQESLASLGFW